MKKSLIALAVAAFASSAVSAASVYDKDGTSLNIGGRIQSVYYSTQNGGSGNNDSSIVNSSRLSLDGRSEIASGISAFGFTEWDLANGDKSSETEGMEAREQFIGVDFGKFGVLSVGRTYDTVKSVIEVTDIFEDYGCIGQVGCDDFRAGTLKYVWEGYGVLAGVSYQSAKDNIVVGGSLGDSAEGEDAMNVEGGFSAVLGYTTPTVLFGPISVKAGYSYLKGQNDANKTLSYEIDNMKEYAASVSWGNAGEGLYLAAMYNQRKFDYLENAQIFNHSSVKGIEAVIAYAFDNGLSLATGWEYSRNYAQGINSVEDATQIVRKVPVYANYEFNPNFNVWAEASFDAGSDKQTNGVLFENEPTAEDHAHFSVGARYTF